MYKHLYDYVRKCVTCATLNLKELRAPVKEKDIPPFSFYKIGIDLSGPYPKILSGNKYSVGFVDLYSGWAEMVPRHGAPFQIIADNGSENENKLTRESLEELSITLSTQLNKRMSKR